MREEDRGVRLASTPIPPGFFSRVRRHHEEKGAGSFENTGVVATSRGAR